VTYLLCQRICIRTSWRVLTPLESTTPLVWSAAEGNDDRRCLRRVRSAAGSAARWKFFLLSLWHFFTCDAIYLLRGNHHLGDISLRVFPSQPFQSRVSSAPFSSTYTSFAFNPFTENATRISPNRTPVVRTELALTLTHEIYS
jgi:hypothetical protein